MKHLKVALLALLVLGIAFSLAFAGDVGKGKYLFNDQAFGGSTNEKSCGSCHPNGKAIAVRVSMAKSPNLQLWEIK